MQKQEKQSSRTQRAVQFSRTNPRTLIPLNYNHVGAHNELLPCTDYEPQYSKLIKWVKKIETIKIINEELVSDFKQVYNNDYNDLINLYHLCLRFCIDA